MGLSIVSFGRGILYLIPLILLITFNKYLFLKDRIDCYLHLLSLLLVVGASYQG